MTPREELTACLTDAICGPLASAEMIGDTEKLINPELEKFAIGRWVPVSESLPEFDGNGTWEGLVEFYNGTREYEHWLPNAFEPGIRIHKWLDLDLPDKEEV